MINFSVKIHTGHLQVQAEEYADRKEVRRVVDRPEPVMQRLRRIEDVEAVTARAEAFSLVSAKERTYGVMIIGIDPRREAVVSTLESTVRRGDYLENNDGNQALVGRLLAENLQAGLGDELVLLGQGRDGSIAATVVKVKGIFRSGQDEFDRRVVHIPLHYFQEVYSMRGAVHRVVAICRDLESVGRVRADLSRALADMPGSRDLAVLDWKELNPGLVQAIQMDLVSGFIFYVILIVVVAFSILNTFLMAIFERTREFGVMMALGTAPARLTRLLLFESATITLIGLAAGIIFGGLLTWYFQIHGIVIPGAEELARQFGLPERMYPQLSKMSVAVGAGIVLVITLITALYPALKVRRLKPVQALSAV
jgi:ABC-type lipoprotein release transport system permease subunit